MKKNNEGNFRTFWFRYDSYEMREIEEKHYITPKENSNQNPEVAKTEKSPLSEHSLKSKSNSEGVTEPVKKESVKKKLKEAEAELKVETELKKAQKLKENVVFDLPTKNDTQIPKLDITNKERGK